MRLPAELIDHIFSFLRGDISALKACSKTHPSFSQLAERYLFADIAVGTTSGFGYENLSKDPRILHYVRTLEIADLIINRPEVLIPEVLSMMPRMENLVLLKFSGAPFWSTFVNPIIVSALRDCLRQSSVEQFCLAHINNFPIFVLDNGKNIKKLTLIDCSAIWVSNPTPPHHQLLLEELSIGHLNADLRNYWITDLLNWITDRIANLKSLRLVVEPHHWTSCSGLLAACSSSLTILHLGFPSQTYFSTGDTLLLDRSCLLMRGISCLPLDPRESDISFLALQTNVSEAAITASVFSTEDGPVVGFDGALPAITNLIKTAPAIQDVVLRLHWVNPTPGSLGRLDYSLLCPGVLRIHLCISGTIDNHSISPASIFETLTENEALMDLVKRMVVILNPRSYWGSESLYVSECN